MSTDEVQALCRRLESTERRLEEIWVDGKAFASALQDEVMTLTKTVRVLRRAMRILERQKRREEKRAKTWWIRIARIGLIFYRVVVTLGVIGGFCALFYFNPDLAKALASVIFKLLPF